MCSVAIFLLFVLCMLILPQNQKKKKKKLSTNPNKSWRSKKKANRKMNWNTTFSHCFVRCSTWVGWSSEPIYIHTHIFTPGSVFFRTLCLKMFHSGAFILEDSWHVVNMFSLAATHHESYTGQKEMWSVQPFSFISQSWPFFLRRQRFIIADNG